MAFAVRIRMLVPRAVICVLRRRAICMNVRRRGVVMLSGNAMQIAEAVKRARAVGESERRRRCKDANGVSHGDEDCRFDPKSFSQA